MNVVFARRRLTSRSARPVETILCPGPHRQVAEELQRSVVRGLEALFDLHVLFGLLGAFCGRVA